MTICHTPQREEKDPRPSHLPSDLNPSSPMLQGVLFHISFCFSYFNPQTFQSTVFNQALRTKLQFTFLSQLQNHLHNENPSLCSALEPLYYSSYATTIEGIRIINFVDSGTPTVARTKESTWECEDTMRATYPFLFRDEGTWFSRLIQK